MMRAQKENDRIRRIESVTAVKLITGSKAAGSRFITVFLLLLSLVSPWTAFGDEKKPEASQPVSITGIQFLTDTGDEAMLMINGSPVDGGMQFAEELVSAGGKEWLRIRMRPAVVREEKRFRLDSEIIGEVRLENDPAEKGAVVVSLELLPVVLTYSVSGVKNSSSVMVSVSSLDQKKGPGQTKK
jgi:hypothetical protein